MEPAVTGEFQGPAENRVQEQANLTDGEVTLTSQEPK
jgi:hypothetical protein